MSTHSRMFFILALVLSQAVSAQRIQLSNAWGDKALVESRTVASHEELAPVEVRLTVPVLDLDKQTDGYHAAAVPGLVRSQAWGAPEVASTGKLIAVPNGFEPEFNVVRSEVREFPNVVVKPAQKKKRCGSGVEITTLNKALYNSRSVFPAKNANLEYVGNFRGVRLFRVALNPLQMDFARKTLKVTTDLVATVKFVRTGRTEPVRLPESLYQLVRNTTANGQELENTITQVKGAESMMIFVADSLKDTVTPLVEWKRAKGIKVTVVTATEAGSTKEKIKEYIQKAYNSAEAKPTHLLFVGNKTTMPAFSKGTSSGNAINDYSYALLAGDDEIPDAFYGRVIADNATEATAQISRWIAYEKSPKEGDWFTKAATIASSGQGSSFSDEQYAQQVEGFLKGATYDYADHFYQKSSTAKPAAISKAIEEGRSWVSYFGHGSGTSWASTNGEYSNSHIAQLKNKGTLPVIIDVACENANWDELSKCFGKAWVTQTVDGENAGAVGFYGGSVSISWDPPAVMSVGTAKYHFEKPVHSLGGTVMAGQLYLIEQMGNNDETMDNLRWYNLFGDPSMEIRTAVPKTYELKQVVSREDDAMIVTVEAMDLNGHPVANVMASINTNSNEPLATAMTDDSGVAKITLPGISQLEPETLLTTTGYNLESHQVKLQ